MTWKLYQIYYLLLITSYSIIILNLCLLSFITPTANLEIPYLLNTLYKVRIEMWIMGSLTGRSTKSVESLQWRQ